MKPAAWSLALLVTAAAAGSLRAAPRQAAPPETAPQDKPEARESTYKVPQTFEDHMQLADRYKKKAVEYRQEAETHKKMLSGYRKDASVFPNKSGQEFPWFTKLRKHCEGYIARADSLAAEADRFAEFHRMRAMELHGE